MSKQKCVNCHFWIKTACNETGQVSTLVVAHDNRKKSQQKDFSWANSHFSLACHLGVWSERISPEIKAKRYEYIVKTKRKGSCFFWGYQPGMSLQTAEELCKRELEKGKTDRNERLTVFLAILTALIALVASLRIC